MTRAGIGLILCCLVAGAGAQTIGYAQAIDLLAANCGKDIATFSTQENLGGGRVQRCLVQNQGDIQEGARPQRPRSSTACRGWRKFHPDLASRCCASRRATAPRTRCAPTRTTS